EGEEPGILTSLGLFVTPLSHFFFPAWTAQLWSRAPSSCVMTPSSFHSFMSASIHFLRSKPLAGQAAAILSAMVQPSAKRRFSTPLSQSPIRTVGLSSETGHASGRQSPTPFTSSGSTVLPPLKRRDELLKNNPCSTGGSAAPGCSLQE